MAKKKKKIRFGFIGGGGISRTHMGYLSKIDDVELVAVADVSEAAMEQCAKQFGFENCFTDYKDLLKMDLDAVSVCTPNFLHYQPTLDALNAGKHVLVEKPMAMNAQEAAEMVETAKKKKKILVIGFQYRFTPAAEMIKRAIKKGMLGNIVYARCQALRRRGIPNWGVFGRKDLQGGGPMIDIGVHIIEVAHYLMGAPKPVSAYGSTYTYMGNKKSDTACPWPNWDYKTYTVEDLAVGMIKFENGATMSIEACFAGHIGGGAFNFVLMGEKGGAQFDPPMLYTDQAGTMVNITPEFLPNDDHFEKKMRHFIECVRTGKPSLAPGEHGLMVQQILDGVYNAAEAGGEVEIN